MRCTGASSGVELVEEFVDRRSNGDPTGGYVSVSFPLHLLPTIDPEPRLVCWDRRGPTDLKGAVWLFEDFQLSSRFVESEPTPKFRREGNEPSLLRGEEDMKEFGHRDLKGQ